MSTIKGDLLKIYIYKIKTLETSIKSFNSKDSAYKGHIINYEEFKNLKKSVEYDKNKNIANTKKFDIKDSEKKIFIKELEFKTSQYLMNMLLNGNKYLIIFKIILLLIVHFLKLFAKREKKIPLL